MILILLVGNLVLIVHPSLGKQGKTPIVRGEFPVKVDQLQSLGIDVWIFHLGLPMNYRLAKALPAELAKTGASTSAEYCLSYERRRLLDSYDSYGSLSIIPGACKR